MLSADNEPVDTDEGPPARDIPARTCIVARTAGDRESLIRFVVGPDGVVAPDVRAKLPGRGAWVTATRAAVAEAVRRKLFARAFRREATVAADLPETVERLLAQAAVEALSLAKKAGLVVTGFGKVEAAVRRGGLAGLIHAADAGADGVGKLDGALSRGPDAGRDVPVLRSLTGEQLDLALGRPNVVHAALLAGPASSGFLARSQRLDRYRSAPVAEGTDMRGQRRD